MATTIKAGSPDIEVPCAVLQHYELDGFRIPKEGDWYLTHTGIVCKAKETTESHMVDLRSGVYVIGKQRLILKPKFRWPDGLSQDVVTMRKQIVTGHVIFVHRHNPHRTAIPFEMLSEAFLDSLVDNFSYMNPNELR